VKYKTFRALMLLGLAVVGIGTIILAVRYCGGDEDDRKVSSKSSPPVPDKPGVTVDRPPPVEPPRALGGDTRGEALRDWDRELIALAGKPLAGGKGKDALGGKRPFKVNLYQDAGKSLPNRAKVDLDRDEKWDEKWTFEDGEVKRQVAPADDDDYTVEYTLVGDRWLTADDQQAATPAPPAADDAESFHQELLDLANRPLAGGKGKDVFSGRAYKVNIYQDAGLELPNRAKIDLDRDEKWDEKWDFEGPAPDRKVKRHVAPADDEQYTVEYRREAGRWRLKP
jgi:hypothetical protein